MSVSDFFRQKYSETLDPTDDQREAFLNADDYYSSHLHTGDRPSADYLPLNQGETLQVNHNDEP